MAELSGIRAVVTGATSGLGEAMARALLLAGATVAVAARPSARLDAVCSELSATAPGRCVAAAMDVRDADSVARIADELLGRLGGVDLVVNNAGIGMRTVNPRFFDAPEPFFSVEPASFADVIATNLTGYFHVARAFAPAMAAAGSGRIVNVTMNHETMRRRGFVPYGPSRAGAESLSLIMTEDLRPHGVQVNLLAPGGATRTGMIPDDVAPRRQLLDPAIMGPPIVFLASDEAAGLTGARLVASEFTTFLAEFRAQRTASS
ncbi:MAG: SDR family NAD(P)-dependent oxidoreductase [Actinomycetota bacterium]|nr:SDR family NAD(P)-dependent oxidoreductase [Actinomycetota bacterium]